MFVRERILLAGLLSVVWVCSARGEIAFVAPVEYPGGTPGWDQSVAAADFDGDGDLDLANVHDALSGSALVRWNVGDGTFSAAVDWYAVLSYPTAVAAADFNGDGWPDLAVACPGFNSIPTGIQLLVNDGTGTFVPGTVLDLNVQNLLTVAAGDLDGDGDVDLAAGYWGFRVRIYRNNGDATFQPALVYSISGQPQSIALGDLDSDGDLDVITANRFGAPDEVTVLLNNSNATFVMGAHFPLSGSRPYSVALADVDGDGDLDAAVANSASTFGDPSVAFLGNNGDATFAPAVYYDAGSTPYAVSAGDFDLDGDVDLAVANHDAVLNVISLLVNDGQGTFGPPLAFPAGGYPYSVLAANLNADAGTDLACAIGTDTGSLTVLINQTPFDPGIAGDLNCDALVNFGDINPFVLALTDPAAYEQAFPACSIVNGDINADGSVDFGDINPFVALLAGM